MAKRKPYIKPHLPVTDKDKIIEFAEDYLIGSDNEFVVMNDFVHNEMSCPEPHGNTNFIGDIAYKMRNTGKYELKESNNRNVVYKKEEESWEQRNPFWDRVRTGSITFLFSIVAAILLYYILPPRASQTNIQDSERLTRHSDSLRNLGSDINALKDTVTKYIKQ